MKNRRWNSFSGYKRRRAGEGSWFKSRRHYNLVQRSTAHRSSIRESHRGDEKLRGSRPDSATTHTESPLRLPRTTVDPWLERLRLWNVERGCSQPAAAKSFLLAPAPPRSKDASSISSGRCLQSKWKVGRGRSVRSLASFLVLALLIGKLEN